MREAFLLFILLGSIGVQAIDCQNGGFPNGAICNCPPNWTGDNCAKIQCLNGGYTTLDNVYCICPSGYMGIHCDAVSKFKTPSGMFPEQKTFTLLYVNLFSNYWGGLIYTQFNNALKVHLNSGVDYSKKYLITNSLNMGINTNVNLSSSYNFITSELDSTSTTPLPPPKSPGQYNCYSVPFYNVLLNHIKTNNLRETAITIFTQHPAQSDTNSLTNLNQIANAFDIRINVVFSDDSTFIRCPSNDPQLQELRSLADKTGGIFVTAVQNSNYSATGTIIDTVLATHYRYEPIVMGVTNGTQTTLQLLTNLPQKKYYIVAYGTNVTLDGSGCTLFDTQSYLQSSSNDSVQVNSWLIPLGYFVRPCPIVFKNARKAQVFGVDLSSGPVGGRLYKSYIEAPYLDTSRTQPNQGNSLSLSFHFEPFSPLSISVIGGSYNEDSTSFPLNFTSSSKATFEWTSSPFNCTGAATDAWISVSLKGNTSNLYETRYIPVFCQTATSSPPVSGSNWEYELFQKEEMFLGGEDSEKEDLATTADPSTTPTPATQPAKTYILGYSDLANIGAHDNYILGAIPPGKPSPYNSFGEIRFDTKLVDDTYKNQGDDYNAFQTAVQSLYGLDQSPTVANPPASFSNVLDALKNIKASNNVTQNSIISINLARLLKDGDGNIADFYYFVNNNIKIVFFMHSDDLTTVVGPGYNQKVGILSQIAALTAGHFIVCNELDNLFKSLILPTVFGHGPGQNLLLSTNLQGYGFTSTILGQIDLTSFAVNSSIPITVTMTKVVADGDDGPTATSPIPPPLRIGFYSFDGSQTNSIIVTLNQSTGSNFYFGSANINTGIKYVVRPASTILSPSRNTHIRIWTPIDTNAIDLQIKYYALDNTDLNANGPNDYDGAALGVSSPAAIVDRTTKIIMNISDCTGQDLKLYDTNQTFELTSGETRFVPFFCTNSSDPKKAGCFPGAENLYFARFVVNDTRGSYTFMKSFICQMDERPSNPDCDKMDSRGNVLCTGNDSPYTRGRAGKLIDCSDSIFSHLKYDPDITSKVQNQTNTPKTFAPFSCDCDGQGFSCERTLCAPMNTAGGAVDVIYRTLTFVLAVGYPGSMSENIDDASLLFTNMEDLTSIWQFQFLLACSGGDVVPIYIGRDQNDFMAGFDSKKQAKPYQDKCSNLNQPFYLNNILEATVSSIGRQQRGLIIFYHELVQDTQSNITVAVSLPEFIQKAQKYRQEFYIYNVYDPAPPIFSPDVLTAVMTTGGTIIQCSWDEMYNNNNKRLPAIFMDMLNGATSLNAHQVPSNSISPYLVPIETNAETYLVISASGTDVDWRALGYTGNCKTPPSENDPTFGLTCVLDPTKTLKITPKQNLWFSVISTKGPAPLGIFISQRSDDQTTAYAVNYTVGGPTLAVYSPTGYSVTGDLGGNARVAKRQSCTYLSTSAQVFNPIPAGYSNIALSFSVSGTPAVVVNKIFSFGVSNTIDCVPANSKQDNNSTSVNKIAGNCICNSDNWEGPDCSRPKCANGQQLSTWGDACNCGSGFIGQFCENLVPTPSPPLSTTTTVPSTV